MSPDIKPEKEGFDLDDTRKEAVLNLSNDDQGNVDGPYDGSSPTVGFGSQQERVDPDIYDATEGGTGGDEYIDGLGTDIDDGGKELYGTEEFEMFDKKVVIKGIGGWIQEMSRYITNILGYQATEHLHPYYEEMIELIIEDARKVIEQAKEAGEKHPVICEIGAGTGIVSYILAKEFPDAIIIAVEVDQAEYELLMRRTRESFDILDGRVNVPQFPPNVHPVWANAENIELPETGAHLVVQVLTYHHIRLWRKSAVQRRITAMLKKAKELNPRVNPKSIIADEHPSQERVQTFREMRTNLRVMHADFIGKIIEEGGKLRQELDSVMDELSKKMPKDDPSIELYRKEGSKKWNEIVVGLYRVGFKQGLGEQIQEAENIYLKMELLEILRENESSSLTEGQTALDEAQKFLKKAYDLGITEGISNLTLTTDKSGTPQEYPTPLQWEEIAKRWIIYKACEAGLRVPNETDTDEKTMSSLVRKLKERGAELPPEKVGENKTSVDDQAATAIEAGQIGVGSSKVSSAKYEPLQDARRPGIYVSSYVAYDPSGED